MWAPAPDRDRALYRKFRAADGSREMSDEPSEATAWPGRGSLENDQY